jgi:hypothetical protein
MIIPSDISDSLSGEFIVTFAEVPYIKCNIPYNWFYMPHA